MTASIQTGDNTIMKLIEMIKEQDEKFARSILDLENFVCTLGRLVDDIIDKDLGLCVDYKLVEDAVELLQDKKWMDSQRQSQWDNVIAGLCGISVEKLEATRNKDNPDANKRTIFINRKTEIREEERIAEDYRVAQLKGEV